MTTVNQMIDPTPVWFSTTTVIVKGSSIIRLSFDHSVIALSVRMRPADDATKTDKAVKTGVVFCYNAEDIAEATNILDESKVGPRQVVALTDGPFYTSFNDTLERLFIKGVGPNVNLSVSVIAQSSGPPGRVDNISFE